MAKRKLVNPCKAFAIRWRAIRIIARRKLFNSCTALAIWWGKNKEVIRFIIDILTLIFKVLSLMENFRNIVL